MRDRITKGENYNIQIVFVFFFGGEESDMYFCMYLWQSMWYKGERTTKTSNKYIEYKNERHANEKDHEMMCHV